MYYFDYPASTPVLFEVQKFQNEVENMFFANTESRHALAAKSNRFYKRLEEEIVRMLSDQFNYTFTSGATEANNMGIQGLLKKRKQKGNTVLVLPIEHASVLETMKKLKQEGMNIQYVPVDTRGVVQLDVLGEMLNTDVNMVVAMTVNNEIGVIQPYEQIRELIDTKAPEALFFSDCVQALGKFDIDFNIFDAFSASSHKLYGPKGIGLLAIKKSLVHESDRIGGKHQEGRRAGTIPTQLIGGLMKAIELSVKSCSENHEYVSELYTQLETEMKQLGFVTRPLDCVQSPYIFSCYHLGIKALPLQQYLSDNDIYIGTQSSCSEGANKQSAILTAIALSQEAASSVIRIGLSPKTRQEDLHVLVSKISEAIQKYSV